VSTALRMARSSSRGAHHVAQAAQGLVTYKSGWRAVLIFPLSTAHCLLPTTHYFRREEDGKSMERFVGCSAQSAQTSRLRVSNRPHSRPGHRSEYGHLQRDACGVARATALSGARPVGRNVGQERQEEPDAAAGFVSKS